MKPSGLIIGGLAALCCYVSPVTAQSIQRGIIPIIVGSGTENERISVAVDPGLRSNKQLRSRELRQARDAMHAGDEVSADHLRRLALAGDGLAAQRYVRLLEARETKADPSDIAYFAAIAVGTGRIWTLDQMLIAMHQLDPKTEPNERIRKYIQVLYPHAWAGNSAALQALIDFNGEGRLFGPLSESTRLRIAEQAKEQSSGNLELTLAMGILETQRAAPTQDMAEIAKARAFLERAEASDHLAVKTTAQNLLRIIDNG